MDRFHNADRLRGKLPIGYELGGLVSDGFLHAVRFMDGPLKDRVILIPFKLPDQLTAIVDGVDGGIAICGESFESGYLYRCYAKGGDPLHMTRSNYVQGGVFHYVGESHES